MFLASEVVVAGDTSACQQMHEYHCARQAAQFVFTTVMLHSGTAGGPNEQKIPLSFSVALLNI